MNLLLNPLTHIQMMKLLSKTLRLKKTEVLRLEERYEVQRCKRETDVI